MTQARNFETAMFFSIMQGHVGTHASVMEMMKFVCVQESIVLTFFTIHVNVSKGLFDSQLEFIRMKQILKKLF